MPHKHIKSTCILHISITADDTNILGWSESFVGLGASPSHLVSIQTTEPTCADFYYSTLPHFGNKLSKFGLPVGRTGTAVKWRTEWSQIWSPFDNNFFLTNKAISNMSDSMTGQVRIWAIQNRKQNS